MELKEKHEACVPAEDEILYKIGMFAAMNHVTVKTLRFYEEQGLLIPARINDENGYRYYTMNQMAVIHQITALKEAGFTLDDIRRINAGSDEEAVIHKKKSELLSKIAELTRQVSILDGYLARNKGMLSAPVLVKTIPESTVAYLTERIESYDCLFEMMPRLGELMEEAGCECALPEYCFTSYPEPGYKEDEIAVEICQTVTRKKEDTKELHFKCLPEINAACIFHKGSYADFPESYEIIIKFIKENGFKIAGPIREKYIDGVWNREDESEWLSEIQIPIMQV